MALPGAATPPAAGETGLNMGTIFNLSRAVVMVVDDNPYSLRLTTQTLLGFGIKTRHLCNDAQSAVDILKTHPVDLLIVDCDMPGPDGYDMVSWLRRSNLEPNAYVPTLMISGHTRASQVTKARDCGANFIITRPITAGILLERILWMARDPRPFVNAGDYAGPDRRFKEEELPEGQPERRADRLRGKASNPPETEGSREDES
jgi:DNA-binding response OmpR family regulator